MTAKTFMPPNLCNHDMKRTGNYKQTRSIGERVKDRYMAKTSKPKESKCFVLLAGAGNCPGEDIETEKY